MSVKSDIKVSTTVYRLILKNPIGYDENKFDWFLYMISKSEILSILSQRADRYAIKTQSFSGTMASAEHTTYYSLFSISI